MNQSNLQAKRSLHTIGLRLGFAGALTISAMAPALGQTSTQYVHGAVTGDTLFSNDSDHFREARGYLGYLFPTGWGLGGGLTYYGAPDWSARGRGLYGQYRSADAQQTVSARLGVMDTDGHTTPTGTIDYIRHVTANTGLGMSAERDVVDSINGIEKGLTYNSLALVLDHQFTPRFSVGAVAGATYFSDHNTRPFLRTRWNFELISNSGLNVFVKTRHYYDTDPGLGDYYSPRWLGEVSGGLSWRTALSDKAVFFVSADAGRQNTENGGTGIWSARIGLQNHRSKKIQWLVAVETTNNHTSGFTSGGDGYRYTSITGQLVMPFN